MADSFEYTMRLDNLDRKNPVVLCAKKVFKFGQVKYYIATHPNDLDSRTTCVSRTPAVGDVMQAPGGAAW